LPTSIPQIPPDEFTGGFPRFPLSFFLILFPLGVEAFLELFFSCPDLLLPIASIFFLDQAFPLMAFIISPLPPFFFFEIPVLDKVITLLNHASSSPTKPNTTPTPPREVVSPGRDLCGPSVLSIYSLPLLENKLLPAPSPLPPSLSLKNTSFFLSSVGLAAISVGHSPARRETSLGASLKVLRLSMSVSPGPTGCHVPCLPQLHPPQSFLHPSIKMPRTPSLYPWFSRPLYYL